MKVLKFYSFFLLLLLNLFIFSCSKDKETPANVIEDATGVKIDLVWSTGSTTLTAKTEADLDLYLKKDTIEVLVSEKTGSFESIDFSDSLTDSDYTVSVEYFEGTKNVTYDLIITGNTSNKSYKLSSEFVLANSGLMNIDVLKITKTGTKYTINKL